MDNRLLILYTLLKVRSRKGLGFFEWVWFKCHKNLSSEETNPVLDDLWQGKFIQEEPWGIDEQGRELIPSLPHKRFFLTEKGEKELGKVKGLYLWCQVCKCVLLLIKGLFYAISIAASLYGLIELYEWCIKWL